MGYIVAVNHLSEPYIREYCGNLAKVLEGSVDIYHADKKYTLDESSKYIFVAVIPHNLTLLSNDEKQRLTLINIDQLTTKYRTIRFDHIKYVQNTGIRVLHYTADHGLNPDTNLIKSEMSDKPEKSENSEESIVNDNLFPRNMKLSQQIQVIPCLIDKDETCYLRELISNTEIKYDVAFCGLLIGRRLELFNNLKSAGLSVIDATAWGLVRDTKIASARILLNIHVYEEYKMYECIRCDRWLAAGKLVVTENCLEESYNSSRPMLIIANYNKLIETIVNILKCYSLCQEQLNRYLANNLDAIIDNRIQECQRYFPSQIISTESEPETIKSSFTH